MQIKSIVIRQIFDSRGEPTLDFEIQDYRGNIVFSQIPRGKSIGSNEVQSFDYEHAKKVVAETVLPKIQNLDFKNVSDFDNFLIELDGTVFKSKLGGNVMLGLSIGFAKILANNLGKQLYLVLQEEFFREGALDISQPVILANFINGGAHAKNNLSFQEYLVLGFMRDSVGSTINKLIRLYQELEKYLTEYCHTDIVPIGDEAGYSINFKNNLEPLEILEVLIKKNHLEKYFKLGLDVAASHFYRDGFYFIDNKKYDSNELLGYYEEMFKKFSLLYSIEDPFFEGDQEGFKSLMHLYGDTKLIIGDDLTATNVNLITRAHTDKMINGLIIKPNQIGTITETAIALKTASQYNMKSIVSHRSGETEDNFIIDLAKAAGAFGVKIGAPARERILKYNQLIRLYE